MGGLGDHMQRFIITVVTSCDYDLKLWLSSCRHCIL